MFFEQQVNILFIRFINGYIPEILGSVGDRRMDGARAMEMMF